MQMILRGFFLEPKPYTYIISSCHQPSHRPTTHQNTKRREKMRKRESTSSCFLLFPTRGLGLEDLRLEAPGGVDLSLFNHLEPSRMYE